jgi:large subunit ribosomal protein L20
MVRVKKGVNALKARRNTLKQVKGYRFGRSTKERQALDAIAHAGNYAFAHRRDKKNDRRAQFTIILGVPLKEAGVSYSKFIGALKKANIIIDRKILSILAKEAPKTFNAILEKVK